MFLRSASQKDAAAARDMLGLALLVSGPSDDAVAIASALLGAAALASPQKSPADLVAELAHDLPDAASALRAGQLYSLQEQRDWQELVRVLEARVAAGKPTFEERTMLAGLYRASDRPDDAEKIYAALLAEDPSALQLWPERIAALFAAGRREQALAAKQEALDRIAKDPREWQGVRDRIDRLE
jgi:tetratricopeptide (TPR) repeat protein